jgi:hypothetical protein
MRAVGTGIPEAWRLAWASLAVPVMCPAGIAEPERREPTRASPAG